jgi:putative ABC transport system permease protein
MKMTHKLMDVLRLGLASLVVHKVRSSLTILGILCGVWSVIAMLAINAGLGEDSQRALRELGSNNIIIDSIKPPSDTGKATEETRGVLAYGLKKEDIKRLRTNIPQLVRCVTSHRTLKYAYLRGRKLAVSVIATEPSYSDVAKIDMASGRFLTTYDVLRSRPFCVVSASLVRRLFGYGEPIGQTLRMAGEPFQVIGVMRELPRALAAGTGGDVGSFVLIPLTTDRIRFSEFTIMVGQGGNTFEHVEVSQAILQMSNEQAVVAGAQIAHSLLARFHDKQDYEIRVPLEKIALMKKDRQRWSFMFTAIAAVSLLVGGIGIMNIMLASVTERTREIGIRRALGAKRRDIVVQFLVEAVTLTTVGGVLGVGLGLLVPWLIEKILGFNTIVSAVTLILPLLMAMAVGLLSGLYPATRAAGLDPIAALRHE